MQATKTRRQGLSPSDSFAARHIGPGPDELRAMLETLKLASLDALADSAVPRAIRTSRALELPAAQSEHDALATLAAMAAKNQVFRSYLGMGYHDTVTPPVIQRAVLENPDWSTAYTPYQAEIAQGRLEALINFQTMVMDLTGLEVANASLLDEATAAAEAMQMSLSAASGQSRLFFVSQDCHPQTIEIVRTRASALGVDLVVGPEGEFDFSKRPCGVLLQYPKTGGEIVDYAALAAKAKQNGALVTIAADLLSLVLIKSPGELGADVAIGSTQRFGVPLGYGGPHAAYFATRDAFKRMMPGRIVGLSKDAAGKTGYRLALQTREQHIRREKATSNICTAQVLLAVIAGMYAVYHGPEGLAAIARRVHRLTAVLAAGLERSELEIPVQGFFDTIAIYTGGRTQAVLAAARARGYNLRQVDDSTVGISLDETATREDVEALWAAFGCGPRFEDLESAPDRLPDALRRTQAFLTHPVFHRHRSETQMLRYLRSLADKDLALDRSMIPLGSCTMKLNAATEMLPVTWDGFASIHPFAPEDQAQGYRRLIKELEAWLAEITGYDAVSLQPNAGSQGEFAGLLAIRAYHASRGEAKREVCLIPSSAHGTNPASAHMAGMRVVVVDCDAQGNVDVADLERKATQHERELAALMVTYPSTHGVFEARIRQICDLVHRHGGQVYLDGANLNALVGLAAPGAFGADVSHLNLHKTFCIPHGGGGPGVGPLAVKAHLAPFLPGRGKVGPVAGAPFGSAGILPISWAYIAMMGAEGLTEATEVAILNANYMAKRLAPHYPVLYTGPDGMVAHECIIDLRPLKDSAGILVDDVAKRLMDFGFHAPTMSFPVAGTLMIEPTESESKGELDRFCDAMIAIREEIRAVEEERLPREDNPLKNAPHTAASLLAERWTHPYSREQAAYPLPWVRANKYWPPVGRVDHVYGDRNVFCVCPPVAED